MKIRTVKGPLGGKSYELNESAGVNDIVLTGPKRMTRKQRYEMMRSESFYDSNPLGREPYVRAVYRLAMRHISTPQGDVYAPCLHPDGSLFYEYVEGSAS